MMHPYGFRKTGPVKKRREAGYSFGDNGTSIYEIFITKISPYLTERLWFEIEFLNIDAHMHRFRGIDSIEFARIA